MIIIEMSVIQHATPLDLLHNIYDLSHFNHCLVIVIIGFVPHDGRQYKLSNETGKSMGKTEYLVWVDI